jgi:hypothetical protein
MGHSCPSLHYLPRLQEISRIQDLFKPVRRDAALAPVQPALDHRRHAGFTESAPRRFHAEHLRPDARIWMQPESEGGFTKPVVPPRPVGREVG